MESPNPLKPPEETSPKYLHPDKCGFGAYGFTPEAYEDVQRLYPFFRNICWQQILESSQLYELANQAYADWLLGQLKFYLKEGASWQEIFDLLHQVWNVGLSGFKNGKIPVSSRFKRAEEFKKMFYL
ncbi:MAG: hypothetical protein N2606_03845 [Candidatus Omnitrophica bacterium]|nr:hypothetical protein [Candidatus Omnitrophota bacterium]